MKIEWDNINSNILELIMEELDFSSNIEIEDLKFCGKDCISFIMKRHIEGRYAWYPDFNNMISYDKEFVDLIEEISDTKKLEKLIEYHYPIDYKYINKRHYFRFFGDVDDFFTKKVEVDFDKIRNCKSNV